VPISVFAQRRSFSFASFRPFSSSVVQDDDDDHVDVGATLEETYSRKTPQEHILLRPAMYIGSTERLPPVSCWVLKEDSHSPSSHERSDVNDDSTTTATATPWSMQREELPLVPALLKVFDEILVNASDNHLRHPGSCDRIDVVINRGEVDPSSSSSMTRPYISVSNNGRSIPVRMHKVENMYVPELLFGHLLTGSNFNDDQRTLTGGRHGYGAKLTNVFSKEFVVEIRDGHGTRGGKIKRSAHVDGGTARLRSEADERLLERVCRRD
jgi:DNA topoisomerase-2